MATSSEAVNFYSSIQGDYRVFSNFHLCRFDFNGKTWPSSEHAFQAMKFSHDDATPDDLAQVRNKVD